MKTNKIKEENKRITIIELRNIQLKFRRQSFLDWLIRGEKEQ